MGTAAVQTADSVFDILVLFAQWQHSWLSVENPHPDEEEALTGPFFPPFEAKGAAFRGNCQPCTIS
jgi:hypothetical protein